MTTILRNMALRLLFAPALFAPAAVTAQTPFDGTWRINYDRSKLSDKPDVFLLKDGRYNCSTCTPKFNWKADGTDQPVTGEPGFDTVSVRVVDSRTVIMIFKKDGKIVSEGTSIVSSDGNTLTSKSKSYLPDNGQTAVYEDSSSRVGPAPADGSHAISGSWRTDKMRQSENVSKVTWTSKGDELSFVNGFGTRYTAKIDGKDYPVTGSNSGWTSVSLKWIDDRTVEQVSKGGSETWFVTTMTVSPDGKSMTRTSVDKRAGETNTLVWEKQ